MQQQALRLSVVSPLSVSAFAAGLGSLQLRKRLLELPQVIAVSSVQYKFSEETASLHTKLCIQDQGMENTLKFIEKTESQVEEWLDTVHIDASDVALSLPES